MKNKKYLISAILIVCAIAFTILVKVVDVKQIGEGQTIVGFATVNEAFLKNVGVHMVWYKITEYLGYIPLLIAVGYATVGLVQLIKRKSVFKVDKEIIILGAFYIFVVAIYLLFEKVIINYRPILIDGKLEASYPSSHTLMSICILVSSIIINKRIFDNKYTKIMNIFSILLMLVIVVGRLISGIHWFTDIIGGIIISSALLMLFYSLISSIKRQE